MISHYEIINSLKRLEKSGELQSLKLDESEKNVVNKETGQIVCTVDDYVNMLRKKHHCDFEVVYDEHATLSVIYRCNECGTIIFAKDDEDYDPNLECPSCGGYKTYFEFWTKEDIEQDESKKDAIRFYESMQKLQIESAARYKNTGLNDWELWKKEIHWNKNCYWTITLERMSAYGERIRGLNLHINVWGRENKEDTCFIGKRFIRIPLSPYAVYIQWIIPRTKKYKEMTKSMRSECQTNSI